jgi:hypothetical protein
MNGSEWNMNPKRLAGCRSTVPFVFKCLDDLGELGQNTGIFPSEKNPLRRSSFALLPYTWFRISFSGRNHARTIDARVLTQLTQTAEKINERHARFVTRRFFSLNRLGMAYVRFPPSYTPGINVLN